MAELADTGEYRNMEAADARKWLGRMTEEVRKFEGPWGNGGRMALLTQAVGEKDEVMGADNPQTGCMRFQTHATATGLDRQYVWNPNGTIHFEVDDLQQSQTTISGDIDTNKGMLQARCENLTDGEEFTLAVTLSKRV